MYDFSAKSSISTLNILRLLIRLYFESSYLQANSRLTWRDMQHIVIQTANSEPLLHEDGWAFNGIGRKFSHKVSVFLEGLFFKHPTPPRTAKISGLKS